MPRRQPQISKYTFGIQVLPLFANGIFTLFWPASAANLPNSSLQGTPIGTIRAISLTSLSLGTFYAIAAYQNNTPIILTGIPGRFLAAFVFYMNGGAWRRIAGFEAGMGVLTAVGAWWDWYWGGNGEVKEE